ncbi:hypothetical protein NHX12_018863, partial [Muraenolepis orangiensis]
MAADQENRENTKTSRGTPCHMGIQESGTRASRPTIIFNPDFFVEKLRHEQPELFTELVLSNLTRLIDLPGSEFSELLGEEALKTPTGSHGGGFFRSFNFLKRKDKDVVFGTPLSEGSIAQIYQLIEYLSKNLQLEGLFRVPGNSVRQQTLRDLLNNMTRFDQQGNKTLVPDKERQIEQDKNKMSAFNLALMFAPHVLWPRYMTAGDLKDNLKKLNNSMAFLIRHSQKLFRAPAYLREHARLHFAGSRVLQTKDDLELLAANSTPVQRSPVGSKRLAGPLEPSASQHHTEDALKELFRHVQHNMPDSAKKKKLIQQIAKQTASGTPPPSEYQQTPPGRTKKHPRSCSFGGLIKRKARGDQLTNERRLRQISPVTATTGKPGKENVVLQAVNSPLMFAASGKANTVALKRTGGAAFSKERLHQASEYQVEVRTVVFEFRGAPGRLCAGATVDCHSLGLHTVPKNIPRGTERLDLNGNNLTVITKTDLSGLKHLRVLHLMENQISNVERGAFDDLKELERLCSSLSSRLNRNHLSQMPELLFQKNELLSRLQLDKNQIVCIEEGAFRALRSLEVLRLHSNALRCDCHLAWLAPWLRQRPSLGLYTQCTSPPNLRGLNLAELNKKDLACTGHDRDNGIKSVPPGAFSSYKKLKRIHLAQNPFVCDCSLRWLADFLRSNPVETSGARCASPHRLANKRISQIKSTKFRCSGTEDRRLNYECNGRPVRLNNNDLSVLEATGVFKGLSHIKKINLSNNKISEIEDGVFEGAGSVVELHLTANHLQSVRGAMFRGMEGLRMLNLLANPFNCDCRLSWLGVWLRNRRI